MRPYLSAFAILLSAPCAAQDRAGQPLPTGQRLTPTAAPGARFEPLVARTGPDPAYVVDGAAAIAGRPDGREMLVLTSGFNRFNGTTGRSSRRSPSSTSSATRSTGMAADGCRR